MARATSLRLTREPEVALSALREVADAHRAFSGDADSAFAVGPCTPPSAEPRTRFRI